MSSEDVYSMRLECVKFIILKIVILKILIVNVNQFIFKIFFLHILYKTTITILTYKWLN